MSKYTEIETKINKMSKDFKDQIRALTVVGQSEISDFAIDIKTDENKDVVRFVIHANDVLNTKQIHITNAIVDILEEMLNIKKEVVAGLDEIENRRITPKKVVSKGWGIIEKITGLKTILALIVILGILGIFITMPDQTIELFRSGGLKELLKGILR